MFMKTLITSTLISFIMYVSGTCLTYAETEKATTPPVYTVACGDTPAWNIWSPQLMQQALAEGHPVYVDYTAKWCATCLSNNKSAYPPAVCRLFEQYGVVLMQADKTYPDPEIDAAMQKLHRSDVPTNALYIPGDRMEPPAVYLTKRQLDAEYLSNFLTTHLRTTASTATQDWQTLRYGIDITREDFFRKIEAQHTPEQATLWQYCALAIYLHYNKSDKAVEQAVYGKNYIQMMWMGLRFIMAQQPTVSAMINEIKTMDNELEEAQKQLDELRKQLEEYEKQEKELEEMRKIISDDFDDNKAREIMIKLY